MTFAFPQTPMTTHSTAPGPWRTASLHSVIGLVMLLALGTETPSRAQNPQAPAAALSSLEEIVETVPRDVILATRGGAKKEAAASSANDVLRTKVQDQPATLKFKVDRIQKERRTGEQFDRIAIKAEDERVRSSVTTFKGFLWVHIVPADTAKASELKKGAEITVTGKIAVAKITAQTTPLLNVDMVDATLK